MTNYLHFLAETASTGEVMGLRPGVSPDQVESVLGDQFFDDTDRRKRRLRRDYDLIEFFFERDTSTEWICRSISIQVHRLAYNIATPPNTLRKKYGEFPSYIPFSELSQKLVELNKTIEPINRDIPLYPYDDYRITNQDSIVDISVIKDEIVDAPITVPAGSIWSLSIWKPTPTKH